ncbi:hypothetical protein FisN_14Lu154 [Fistulifera solaris]|uniref:Uncharacterized protein n=1 Tax=Fistulifera solaris TaxID=1519565 RepID=A0A1Z5J9H6_FISSO|nr:hypothetical protein FisN_14Lu154 [Fistulifera solaris]|eukprot:GAX10640.1 hypothetical protein FisN_14Lu154 [Fistulifera solaris]
MDSSCSSLQRLLTPEQATAACDTWRQFYEQVWLPLHIPTRTVWQQAWWLAVQDTREATASSVHFWMLTLRPFVLFVRMTLQWILQIIWKYVIVKGISQQGVHYVKTAARRWYRWQRSLTREQLVMELVLIVLVLALYYLHRFLQRQTYFQRLSAWVRAKMRVLQLYYDRSKRATAKVRTLV